MALVGGSRPYPTHTKLGRIMLKRGLRAYKVAAEADVYVRSMTDYLAGRKKPSPRNMAKLAGVLGVTVPDLTEKKYPWLKEDQDALDAANQSTNEPMKEKVS